MPVPVVPAALALTQLIQYLVELKAQNEAGELTDEDLAQRWASLKLRRDATKNLWMDAKSQGGYN